MTKKKNKTINANPLTDYLSPTKKSNNKPTRKIEEQPEKKNFKTRVTIHMSVDLIDKVKNAVFWEPGLTLTEFAERAFMYELRKWEKDWGEEYPQRQDYQLKGGRPLK